MFFDIHTHAFHPKIAHKAVDHLNTVYHLDCRGDGTIEHLLEREKAAGIDRCIVLCAATAPAQVIPANNYAMKLQREHEEVIGFGTLHPAYVDWEDELERMKAGGLRGIKLHPDFQGFAFMLADLMRSFPRLRVIGAHFGGYQMWDYSLEALGDFENLWIDTSSTTPYVTPSLLQRLLARHSPDRLLFGTDWPLYDPAHELERLRTMSGLSEDAIERILSNAGRLLGIGA